MENSELLHLQNW